jgi:hypothetical protein
MSLGDGGKIANSRFWSMATVQAGNRALGILRASI